MASRKNTIIDVKPAVPEPNAMLTSPTRSSRNFIMEIILSTCGESTAHGIGPIIKRDHLIVRLAWIICLFASALVCGYMIVLSILNYYDYETVSKTEKVHLISTEFPAVTICNANPFMTNVSIQFVNETFMKNNIFGPLDPTKAFNYYTAANYPFLRYFAATNALDPARNNSFRRSLGFDISDMVFSCAYNLEPCSPDEFTWFFDSFYGNCFTFNSGKYSNGSTSPIRITSKIGAINSFKLELYVYEPKNLLNLALSTAARIVIHNQTHKPTFDEAILVSAGTETYVEVSRVFTSLLEKPYSDCESNIDMNHPSKLVRSLLSSGYAYTQQDCFAACYQDYLINQCGCFDFSSLLPISSFTSQNIQPCLNLTQLNCDTANYILFFSTLKEIYCGDDCPLECDSVKYNFYSSHADYPTRTYASAIVNNPKIIAKYADNLSELTYDSLKRNMLAFSVFYGDLGYDHYEELIKTEILDLISNIGGTLGLFLGMSFLSIFEIFDILLQICFNNRHSSKIKDFAN